MKRKMLLLLPIICFSLPVIVKAQKIGDDARSVETTVKRRIKGYYNSQGYHQVQMSHQTLYTNGLIKEVILKQENVPHADLGRVVSFQFRYVMDRGKLSKILKEYHDVSLKELQLGWDKRRNKVDKYYVSPDQQSYTTIYLGSNGLATEETKSTSQSTTPLSIKKAIQDADKNNAKTLNNHLDLTITSNGVGTFAKGIKIGTIKLERPYEIIKTEEKRYSEDGESTETIYNLGKGEDLIMKITPQYDDKTNKYNDIIEELNIYGNDCKTSKGIGVGSTLAEFKKAYKQCTVWYTYISNRFVIESDEEKNIQFIIDDRAFVGDRSKLGMSSIDTLDLSHFKETAPLSSIRIY